MNRIQAYFNNFFWIILTYLSAPFLYFRILFKKKQIQKRFLVIQRAKIGDLVCTTPVFRELKEKFPNSYLAALITGKTRDILKNNPRLDEVISLDDFKGIAGKFRLIGKLRKGNYEWSFNAMPEPFLNVVAFWSLVPNRVSTVCKGAGELTGLTSIFNNHRLEYKVHTSALKHYLSLLRFVGINEYSEQKEVFFGAVEERAASAFLEKHRLNKEDFLVGISATSDVEFRQWELEKFAKLADLLIEKLGAKVIFIGTDKDSAKNEEVRKMMKNTSINSAGAFRLQELPAFLNVLKLFISMDTGPIYIANALGVPVVDIVGADDMQEQRPSGPKVRILQKNLYCAPCIFVFSGIRYCKEGHLRCLKEISAEDAFRAAKELYESSK